MNHSFFKNIDSEIKAYLLGFFVGDGCITIREKRKEYSLHITLQKSDIEILYNYKNFINPNKNIKIKDNYCRIDLYSKELINDLINLGYPPQKTYKELHLPNINDSLLIDFIRGYFDADGTCGTYITIRKDRPIGNRVKSTFHICSKTKTLLEEVRLFLSKYNINIPIYYDLKKQVYYLKSGSKREIIKLYLLLYNKANFKLERKKKKFQEVMLTSSEFRRLKTSEPCNA